MDYKIEKEANWISDLPKNIYSNSNFQKIFEFFVVNSIVEGTSARGKKLDVDYGWTKPWAKPYYLNKQLKDISSNKKLIFSAGVYENNVNKNNKDNTKDKKIKETMSEALDKSGLTTFPKYNEEVICIYNSKKNQILSTFAHIRNSIAHSRFNIIDKSGKRIYCFEDVQASGSKFKLSARIVLYEKTLISWIKLICSGEKIYTKI